MPVLAMSPVSPRTSASTALVAAAVLLPVSAAAAASVAPAFGAGSGMLLPCWLR